MAHESPPQDREAQLAQLREQARAALERFPDEPAETPESDRIAGDLLRVFASLDCVPDDALERAGITRAQLDEFHGRHLAFITAGLEDAGKGQSPAVQDEFRRMAEPARERFQRHTTPQLRSRWMRPARQAQRRQPDRRTRGRTSQRRARVSGTRGSPSASSSSSSDEDPAPRAAVDLIGRAS